MPRRLLLHFGPEGCAARGRRNSRDREGISRSREISKSETSRDHRRVGCLHEGTPGDYTTTCVEDRQCVFVTYDGPVAKCAFEKAYLNGEIEWRKPISCHLFPIRVKKSGNDVLWYELNNECSPAVERGNREQIPLTEFLRDALTRKYGEARYEQLAREISTIRCAS